MWKKQLFAVLNRNLSIIYRNKIIILLEVFSPLLLVSLLAFSVSNSALNNLGRKEHPIHFLTPDDGVVSMYFVSPNTSEAMELMVPILLQKNVTAKYFADELEASTEYLRISLPTIVGIHFINKTAYSLRFPLRMLPAKRNRLADFSKKCVVNHTLEHCLSLTYKKSGFAWLQQQINFGIIKGLKLGRNTTLRKTVVFEMLDSNFKVNSFYYILCSFCLIILFIGLLNTFVVSLVGEKEANVVNFMKIMGTTTSAYYITWVSIYFVLALVITGTSCLMMFNVFVLENTNFVLLFIFLIFYGTSFIAMGLVIIEIFMNSNVAGHVVSSLIIIYSLIYIFISRFEFEEGNHFSDLYRILPFYVLIASGLFSPVAFMLGINQVMSLESTGKGLTMETVLAERYSVLLSFMLITFDIFIYVTIFLILNKLKSIRSRIAYTSRTSEFSMNEQEMVAGLSHATMLGFENDSLVDDPYRIPVVSVRKISKIFNKGKSEEVIALNDLNLNIFESEITAVIGHNGAGKTTFLNVLAGICSPTSGIAEINGLDVSKASHMEAVRSLIGFCPQQDMLHPDLTPQEHLRFFMHIKNLTNTSKWTEELVPAEVKDVPISQLSVGQRQKLKFAVALVGNPKILLLDEPTSGMDIVARGIVWKILKQLKSEKVILISTHLMNEADSLADKKAILSNGSLQCCGSSLFLKSHFGIGYHLSINFDDTEKLDGITALVKSYVPESNVEHSMENSIIFNLPVPSKNKFPMLFEAIENHISYKDESLGIQKFNVTISSLEEVLLKIQSDAARSDSLINLNIYESFKVSATKGVSNICSRLLILVKRKLRDDGRSISFVLAKLTFPILFVICFIISSKLINSKYPLDIDGSPFKLDSSLYDPSNRALNSYSNKNRKASENMYINFSFGESSMPHMAINVTDRNVIGSYEETYLHALPILVNSISNLILQIDYVARYGSRPPSIVTFNWVWPATRKDTYAINVQQVNQMLYFISFSVLTVASMFSTSVVVERNKNCFRQLKLANVSSPMYWMANLISDSLQMVVLLILSLVVFFAGQRHIISALYYILVLFILLQSLPSLLLFSYFTTLVCKRTSFVQFYTPILFYLLGFAFHFYLEIHFTFLPFSVKCFMSAINPPYGMILVFDSFHVLFEILHFDDSDSELHHYFKNYYFVCFISPWISSALYFCILIAFDRLVEFGFLNRIKCLFRDIYTNSYAEGSTLFLTDLARAGRSDINYANAVIASKRLTKVYDQYGSVFCCKNKKKTAVSNVSFGIAKNETLGLLGPNGAGKSTLIGMIVNNVTPTGGRVEICGKSQTLCGENVFSKLNFCPQENSCWDNVTVLEHLHFFLDIGRIKNGRKTLIDFLLETLDFQNEKHKMFKDLSSGNKRKLCFAISEICPSEAIVLDEPTAGLDPISRKCLWKCHNIMSDANPRGVLITTHSVEEAEFLCSKLAVIVNGQIQCTGFIQQLKNDFDYGYTLEIKLNSSSSIVNGLKMRRLKEFVTVSLIPGAELINQCYDWVAFRSTQNSMPKLSKVFYLLESNKDSLEIEDYSFGQATIERIFLELFKFQMEDESGGDLNLVDVLPSDLRLD